MAAGDCQAATADDVATVERMLTALVTSCTSQELRAALLDAMAMTHVPAVAEELSEARARLKALRREEAAAAAATAASVASKAEKEADADACVVCLEGGRTHAFLPCGHRAVCMGCSERLAAASASTCPMCREPFQSVVRIFV